MSSILKLLGSKLNETELEQYMSQVVQLEMDLLDISVGISQIKTQTIATNCYPLHSFKVNISV